MGSNNVSTDGLVHPVLAEAETWAVAHRDLLKRTFERFEEKGAWPQLEELQHDFAVGGGDDVDIAALAHAIPRPLGFVEQGRLVLLTRGLSYVEMAAGLLNVWAEALHIACQRWISDHKTAWLTRKDVEELTNGNRHQTNLVSDLLFRERWAFGDRHGSPTEDWQQKVIGSVRIARYRQNATMLLKERATVDFPKPPSGQVPVGPDQEPETPGQATETLTEPTQSSSDEKEKPSRPFTERLRRFFGNPYAVVIIGGVVVLVIWAILSNGFDEVFGDRSGKSALTTGIGETDKHSTDHNSEQVVGSSRYHVEGTKTNGAGFLNVCPEPSPCAGKSPGGRLYEGDPVYIECQARGDVAKSKGGQTSRIWDRLYSGGFVSDLFVSTQGAGRFSKGLPRCTPWK
jgi:hypothetical protein